MNPDLDERCEYEEPINIVDAVVCNRPAVGHGLETELAYCQKHLEVQFGD